MSSPSVILALLAIGIGILVGLLVAELRSRRGTEQPASANQFGPDGDPFNLPPLIDLVAQPSPHHSLATRWRQLLTIARIAVAQHPVKAYGWAETIFWLLIGAVFVNYLIDDKGFVGFIVWVLTIGFHEMGHFICNPFGEFIMFTGGSIWQVLTWLLFAGGLVLFYRRISGALVCWAVAGFSLINLARYIDDARARKMPLLFGLDSTHHDWWWLLSHTNLLPYDHIFAFITVFIGVIFTLSAIILGVVSAWLFPRIVMKQKRRFSGNLKQVVSDRWARLAALSNRDHTKNLPC